MDFESHLRQYNAMMRVPGADDLIKLSELPHWFSGQAELVIKRFLTVLSC